MDEPLEKRWQELSEEVLNGMKEWRLAHPQATFREIEEAVQARMNRLGAQMTQEMALTSEKRDWAQDPVEKRPKCPNCGTALQSRGKRTRTLQSQGGEMLHLTRQYGSCPSCGMGLFPPG